MRRIYLLSALVLVFIGVSCSTQPEAPYVSTGPSVDVPEWAKDVVWYQIFPDRFRNGDPSNDPTVNDIQDSWPYVFPEEWQISKWTGDWYALADWESAFSEDFYRTVQTRRYGGDLAGIIEKLDYLDSLGVTALYLNPVFESPSLHKYDAAFYHHIDNNFGPDPAGDRALWEKEDTVDPQTWSWTSADRLFLKLIDEAHARGMRIIIDGVFNHMGLRSFAFRDLKRNQKDSPFADWFTVTSWDDSATPDTNEFNYEGWMGASSLPELSEDENGLIDPVRKYVFASVRRWMDPDGDGDPSDGIDGWRLDVAEMVNLRFWQDFRTFVRGINPETYLTGEIWWEDWTDYKMFNARPWLEGDAFDAVMNYRWARATRRLFSGSDLKPGESYGPGDFVAEIEQIQLDYPPDVNYVLMNTLGSHDTDRPASQVVNPDTRFDNSVGVRDNPDYRVRKPNAEEWARLKLILALQFTYVGAPHIFYGDEAGMWGADDPDDRKPMMWDDMSFEDEASHPLGLERPRDTVAFNHELFNYFRTLTHLRTRSTALRRGSFTALLADDANQTLAYVRRFGEEQVWVSFNLSDTEQDISLSVVTRMPAAGRTPERTIDGRTVRDVISGETAILGDGSLSFSVPPRSVRIWTLE